MDPHTSAAAAGARVLCAVDDSTEALGAARLCEAIASRIGASLVLVNCSRGELPTAGVVPSAELIEAAVREHRDSALLTAADVLAGVASALPGEPPRVVARTGAAVEGILATARDESPLLLAVGTRGRGALASTVLGSVSAGLLGRSDWPVLVVPGTSGARPRPPARLLAAVAPGDDGVARFAMRMATMLGARATLGHVVPPRLGSDGVSAPLASAWDPGDAGLRASSAGRAAGVLDHAATVDTCVLEGDPAPAILHLATELDTDLIVAGTRRRTGLRSALLGSVSRALVAAGDRPVVVVPSAA